MCKEFWTGRPNCVILDSQLSLELGYLLKLYVIHIVFKIDSQPSLELDYLLKLYVIYNVFKKSLYNLIGSIIIPSLN